MKRLICFIVIVLVLSQCAGCFSSGAETQASTGQQSLAFSAITGRITYIGEDLKAFQVYRIDSLQDMEAFLSTHFPVMTLQSPSPLEEFFAVMNAEFFEERCLLILYCPETQGSSYHIAKILPLKTEIHVQVQMEPASSSPEALMGYLLGASVSKGELAQDLTFVVDVIE